MVFEVANLRRRKARENTTKTTNPVKGRHRGGGIHVLTTPRCTHQRTHNTHTHTDTQNTQNTHAHIFGRYTISTAHEICQRHAQQEEKEKKDDEIVRRGRKQEHTGA